jgi:hypothetical protein
MAFSNTYDTANTGSAVSNREHLTDVLTILAPEETPVLALAKKEKARATFVEWTVDDLASPVTTGVSEGDDVSSYADKFANRARLGNYVQKWRRPWKVSDLQQAVDSVGPAGVAEAESKALREIKRDIEATLCSTNDRAAEDGAGTAYGTRGLGDWIDSSGPSDVPAAYRTPSASIHSSGDVTETVMNNILTSIYREVGTSRDLTLVADTALRNEIVANFARAEGSTTAKVYNINEDATSKKITYDVTLFEGPQGLVSIVNMNPDCAPDTTNKDTGYFVDPAKMSFFELIPMGSSRLENQGGGERGFIDCTGALGVKHPRAFGKITAIA